MKQAAAVGKAGDSTDRVAERAQRRALWRIALGRTVIDDPVHAIQRFPAMVTVPPVRRPGGLYAENRM